MESYVILILGSLMTVVAGVIGVNFVRARGVEPDYVNKKLRVYKDNIEELEIEVKHWKGKYHQKNQLPSIEGDFNLNDVNSTEALIKSILPAVSNILPRDLQGLARDPKIVEYAMKLYQEHPEQAKQLFSKFIKKNGRMETPQVSAL